MIRFGVNTGRLSTPESVNAPCLVWEPFVEYLGCFEQTSSAKVLRVLEHEEEVEVADEDSDQFHYSAALDDQVEAEQHPW